MLEWFRFFEGLTFISFLPQELSSFLLYIYYLEEAVWFSIMSKRSCYSTRCLKIAYFKNTTYLMISDYLVSFFEI